MFKEGEGSPPGPGRDPQLTPEAERTLREAEKKEVKAKCKPTSGAQRIARGKFLAEEHGGERYLIPEEKEREEGPRAVGVAALTEPRGLPLTGSRRPIQPQF